jgi:hypothetical protein
VLSLELSEERDYVQMLVDAQRQMAMLGEQIAGESASAKEDEVYNQLLAHTDELSDAMRQFLRGDKRPDKIDKRWAAQHAAHDEKARRRGRSNAGANESDHAAALVHKLTAAATRCRERRQELSLLVAEPNVTYDASDPRTELMVDGVRRALKLACAALDGKSELIVTLANKQVAAILSNCDRRGALSIANQTISEISSSPINGNRGSDALATSLSIGVATMSAVPRNFDPERMIESAARCLSAARACGISTVKSIEV